MEPGFLIASPQLRDTNFARTVILLIHHDDKGALGLVINRETQIRLAEVVDDPEALGAARANRPVLWGGPVEPSVGFVIYRGLAAEGCNIGGELAVSASSDRLTELVLGGAEFHLALGYAGWGPGQLDREYAEGSWVHLDAAEDLIFSTATADRYDRALARMGLRAELLWMSSIDE